MKAASSSSSQPEPEQQSLPAYFVVETKLTYFKKFSDYARTVPAVIKQYGGEYIARRGKHTPLEGEWGYENENDIKSIIALLKFPSVDAADAFWNLPEYAPVKKLREGSGSFRIMSVEGLP